MLQGLRCCEILETIQKYSILVWNVECWSLNRHHPQLKSRDVVMVVEYEFKSQPCTTIHYTYNETLEGLRCCELPESVQTHAILAWKVDKGQANFCPTGDWETRCGYLFRAHTAISSPPYPTIHYTYNEKLEGLTCCEIFEWIQTYTILVWNVGASYRNCHHPLLKGSGVVMVIHDEPKSEPCLTIHYTYNERLDGLSWYEMADSVCTHSNLMWNVGALYPNFTTLDSKVGVWWWLWGMNSNLNHV